MLSEPIDVKMVSLPLSLSLVHLDCTIFIFVKKKNLSSTYFLLAHKFVRKVLLTEIALNCLLFFFFSSEEKKNNQFHREIG